MADSYKQWFKNAELIHRYEEEYAESQYPAILGCIEQKILLDIVEKLRTAKARIDHLDFACGTGRIISYIESKVDSVTGIDISEGMLEIAAKKTPNARLICTDIADQSRPIEAQYDLITAFRFLGNAEDSLRIAGIKALASRLRDRESLLVVNNHINRYSYKLFRSLLHRLRWDRALRLMAHAEIEKMASQAGLEIVSRHGFGYLSSKVVGILPRELILKVEMVLADISMLQRIGVEQLYVLRLRR